MKNQKTKNLTLMLASVLGAATLMGAVCSIVPASADETSATTYTVTGSSGVFSTSNATSVGTDVVAFDLKDGGKVTLRQRDLAWKWYSAKGSVNYLGVQLALKDANFKAVTLALETASATATEEGKTTNKLVFMTDGDDVYALVNPAEDAVATSGVQVDVTGNLTIQLGEENTDYGEYSVSVGGVAVGKFENVGATFGEYASSSATTPLIPFTVSAEFAEGTDVNAKTNVEIVSINGQSFALNDSGKIEDNAVPVLCVNDVVTGFTIGTTFALDYEVVDVLDRTVTKTMEYYLYNPNTEKGAEVYKTLTTSTAFNETNYMKKVGDEEVETSVYTEYGKELVSIRFTLSDENHKKKDDQTVGQGETVYYLAWYGTSEKAPTATGADDLDYIVIDDNKDGAEYTFMTRNDTAKTNAVSNQALIDSYQVLVENAAEDLVAGSSTDFRLPTLRGMIDDNGGYESLKFTIVYKAQSASSESTKSSLSASSLKFTVSKSGVYEFKVFANDKAGNPMQYYLDGKLVDVTSSNVWKIEEIPYFTFEVKKTGLSIDDTNSESDRKDSVTIGKDYDDFSLKVLGDSASSAVASNKLYRISFDTYNLANASNLASSADLSKITYTEIANAAKGRLSQANGDYDEFFKLIYAELWAQKIGGGVTAQTLIDNDVFVEINAYNDAINEDDHPTEWERHNKYEWNATEASFKAAEEGHYLIISVYSDPLIGSAKACGYKVVNVASTDDVISGESEWIKNNLVSVILFSISGLMFIAIIIIAFIKPSDETLEDVDAAAKKMKRVKNEETKE